MTYVCLNYPVPLIKYFSVNFPFFFFLSQGVRVSKDALANLLLIL